MNFVLQKFHDCREAVEEETQQDMNPKTAAVTQVIHFGAKISYGCPFFLFNWGHI